MPTDEPPILGVSIDLILDRFRESKLPSDVIAPWLVTIVHDAPNHRSVDPILDGDLLPGSGFGEAIL